MIPPEEVVQRILTFAEESQNRTVSGGALSELLKHHLSGFRLADYGTKNLRAFIREHLEGKLNEVGKVGTDIVYGLPGATPVPNPRASSFGNITPEASRVFRSPNAPLDLLANRTTGIIKVVEKGAPIQDPWVRIPSASPETHRQIGKSFSAELPNDDRVNLTRALDEYPNAWWPKFSLLIQQRNLYRRWMAFKNDQLRSKFEATLRDLGVAPTPLPSATTDTERHPRRDEGGAESLPSQEAGDFREAIVRVVQSLPISELRNLRLPAGDLYDAIRRHR